MAKTPSDADPAATGANADASRGTSKPPSASQRAVDPATERAMDKLEAAMVPPPLTAGRVLGPCIGTWVFASLVAVLIALGAEWGEEYVIGILVGLGVGLIDAILSGLWTANALTSGDAPKKVVRMVLISFIMRLLVIAIGWTLLARANLIGETFVLTFFGCHAVLIGTLVFVGNRWLNEWFDKQKEAGLFDDTNASKSDDATT